VLAAAASSLRLLPLAAFVAPLRPPRSQLSPVVYHVDEEEAMPFAYDDASIVGKG
jgi:hypothetical protein